MKNYQKILVCAAVLFAFGLAINTWSRISDLRHELKVQAQNFDALARDYSTTKQTLHALIGAIAKSLPAPTQNGPSPIPPGTNSPAGE